MSKPIYESIIESIIYGQLPEDFSLPDLTTDSEEDINHLIADARKQGRKGVVLTCKDALVDYYAKFGFENEGRSDKSNHGGAAWNQMRLLNK